MQFRDKTDMFGVFAINEILRYVFDEPRSPARALYATLYLIDAFSRDAT